MKYFSPHCKVSNNESEQYQMCVSYTMTEWQPLKLDNHFTGCQTEVFFFSISFFFIYYHLFHFIKDNRWSVKNTHALIFKKLHI